MKGTRKQNPDNGIKHGQANRKHNISPWKLDGAHSVLPASEG